MNRRFWVPLIAIVGMMTLTLILESARRAGKEPTGAATGASEMGCGSSEFLEPPPDLVKAPSVGPGSGLAGPADPDEDLIEGHFVVRFHTEHQVANPGSWARDEGLSMEVERAFPRLNEEASEPVRETWTVRGGTELLQELEGMEEVALIEPLYRTRPAGTPNDPYYGFQWNLSTLGVPSSWDFSEGNTVVVAVLDTGVSSGPDGINLLLPGQDLVDDDPDASDSGWHGTHVAGTIGQVTDNGIGVASIAPGVAILPVRVLGEDSGNTADLAEGIYWAVDEGADILNLSLGTSGESQVVLEALAYAEEEGVLVVAASGNDGYSDFVQFPASVDTVLAVGATLLDASIAAYSNQGEGLDLVAPGGSLGEDSDGDGLPDGVLQEAWHDGEWSYMVAEGTSMATPHVAAVAALIMGYSDLDPAEIRDVLRSSAIDLGDPGPDVTHGYGLLDPVAALESIGGGGKDNSGDDDDDDLGGIGGGGGSGVRPTDGETVTLGQQEGSDLGCGG